MSPFHVDSLPPTKIKRTYKCKTCEHKTVNPREHLNHLKENHDQNIKIVECPLCLYACQYRQKLNRHLKLVHRCLPNLLPLDDTEDALRAGVPSVHPNRLCYDNIINPDMVDSFKAFASQKTLHYYGSDEPMDLSFSPEIKQLLRVIKSTQAQQFYNYQA